MATKRTPAAPPDFVASYTMTDGHGKQFVVDVEIRSDIVARSLARYARDNNSRTSRACDGGVTVRYVREVV
jgi:hypothetical protein